ncbi:hypothetical protein BJ944DRAFT_267189 [Cunninghamella echinulata]|nr:hypothetical protein BJ944DRAFT_267189 [Cunninghamella echinulata]
MTIINHSVGEDGQIKFTIITPKYNLTETLTLQQVLALDPNQIYLYQFSQNDLYNNKVSNIQILQSKLHSMLMDYIEVGHVPAVLEIIETAISSDRLPSSTVVLILSDILLKPIKIKDKNERKEMMERLYKVHSILLRIVERFGPDSLAMMIPIFGTQQQTGRQRRQGINYSFDGIPVSQEQKENIVDYKYEMDDNDEDEDNIQYGSGLALYDSFWDLIFKCFSMPCQTITLEELGARLMLDVLIKTFAEDMKLKFKADRLSNCLLLSTIPVNSYGQRTKLDNYTDIIFEGFKKTSTSSQETANHIYAENAHYASELLNMLILLSYCDQLAQLNLTERTYRQMISLNHDIILHVLQSIEYPGFISAICEFYFQDSDYQCVTKEHQHYRKLMEKPTVKKMVHYIMKTQPKGTLSRKKIYLHCIMVLWYWNAYIKETHYRSANSASSYTLITVRQQKDIDKMTLTDIIQWQFHIMNLLKQCKKEDKTLYSLEIECIFDTFKAIII